MRIACLVVVALAGCAPALKETRGEKEGVSSTSSAALATQMADMQKLMAAMKAAQDDATRTCEPQRARAPGWAEERALGNRLAVPLAAKSGHFYLDGATETDPVKLAQVIAERRPLVLPEGKKNAVSARVAVVGRNLARYSSRPDLPWVFGVIENEAPISFNAPGGYVFVTTGLLKKMTNEAQLAGVLGHEVSHVVQKDTLRLYVEARYKQCIAAKTAAAMLAQGGRRSPGIDEAARFARQFDSELDLDRAEGSFQAFIMNAMLMMLMMGSDKAAEFDHDRSALELLCFAGYDPAEYEKFLAANPAPQHPAGAERAKKLQVLREGELASVATGTAKPDLGPLPAP